MKTISAFGLKFNPVTKQEIVDEVESLLENGHNGIHITGVNHETVVEASLNDKLKDSILSSDYVNIDSFSVVLGLRKLGYKIPERAATPDIFEMFLSEANKRKQSVYLLGAEEWVIKETSNKIRLQYPDLVIAGYNNGFYEDEAAIVEEIRTLSPTFLFIALPSPRKELFIKNYKESINVGVLYGVGGAFDAKSGKLKRAPLWMQRIGLEGFWRVIRKP